MNQKILLGCLGLSLLLMGCSDSAAAFLEKGRALLDAGKYEEALPYLDQAVAKDSENAAAFLARGVAHFELQHYPEARLDFDRAIALAPNDYRGWFNRGNVRRERRELAGALADYSEAIRRSPNLPALYINRATVLEASDRRAALADLEKAIALGEKTGLAHYNLGLLQLKAGQTAAACGHLATAEELRFAKAATARRQACPPSLRQP